MKKLFTLFMVALMSLCLVACGGGEKKADKPAAPAKTEAKKDAGAKAPAGAVKLNLSVPDAEKSSIGVAAKHFADELNKNSNGKLFVQVFYDGSLYGGDATAAVTTMQDGGLDMLCLATTWYSSFNPALNIVAVPYLFKTVDAQQAYFNDAASKPLWDAVEKLGVKYLSTWTRSFRMTTNGVRAITKPEDFKGLKLRTPGSAIFQTFFSEGLGAKVSPMNFSEVYTALQTKTIDGQENPPDVPFSSSFYEVQKFISATNHMSEGWVVGMNPKKFSSLDKDMQALIEKTAKETQNWKKKYDTDTDKADIDFMVKKGMQYNELTPEAFAAFQKVSEGLYPKFKAIIKNDALWDATIAFAKAH